MGSAAEPIQHAFVTACGATCDLGTYPVASGRAINDRGHVTGWSSTASAGTHAFFSTAAGMTDLGSLGGTYTSATAINNFGQIVGSSTLSGDLVNHAWVSTGGALLDLNTLSSKLLRKGNPAGFLSLDSATAITDNGKILGYGTYSDGTSTNAQAFVLDTQGTKDDCNDHDRRG